MPSPVQTVLDTTSTLVFPGIFDTLSAKLAEQAGFELAFVSGYAVAATLIGEPDVGLLTQSEIVDRARQICRSVSIPVLVDADTGYGNPLNVVRTVSELIDAGAAGCFLEDQVWPKRCGHMAGKQVVSRSEYLEKISAAVATRGDRDFFIVARTDAIAAVDLDEAVARVEAAKSLGADATFIEAPRTLEELADVGRRAPKPTLANMVDHGQTPLLARDSLADLGFSLVLYPVAGLYAAASGLRATYDRLRTDGVVRDPEPGMTFERFNELVGAHEKLALAERFGRKSDA